MKNEANIELTLPERDELLEKGFVEIDDPERGHIQISLEGAGRAEKDSELLFSVGRKVGKKDLVGKTGVVRVLRPGTAATRASED